MKKPKDIFPTIVLKLAANVGAAGEAKRILSHYKKYGQVPEEYQAEFYNIGFGELRTVIGEQQTQ